MVFPISEVIYKGKIYDCDDTYLWNWCTKNQKLYSTKYPKDEMGFVNYDMPEFFNVEDIIKSNQNFLITIRNYNGRYNGNYNGNHNRHCDDEFLDQMKRVDIHCGNRSYVTTAIIKFVYDSTKPFIVNHIINNPKDTNPFSYLATIGFNSNLLKYYEVTPLYFSSDFKCNVRYDLLSIYSKSENNTTDDDIVENVININNIIENYNLSNIYYLDFSRYFNSINIDHYIAVTNDTKYKYHTKLAISSERTMITQYTRHLFECLKNVVNFKFDILDIFIDDVLLYIPPDTFKNSNGSVNIDSIRNAITESMKNLFDLNIKIKPFINHIKVNRKYVKYFVQVNQIIPSKKCHICDTSYCFYNLPVCNNCKNNLFTYSNKFPNVKVYQNYTIIGQKLYMKGDEYRI